MDQTVLDDFLSGFDDSRYPEDFLQSYEPMECFSSDQAGETLLVRERRTGIYYVAKCYREPSLLPHATEGDLLKNLHHTGLPAYMDEYRSADMLCVVREYAQGVPLDRLSREKPFSERQILSIAEQLCDIMIYLHGQTRR